ncbi:hypothetical protein [Sporichthya polymorpha]|uniref:hypothetical protein n=1 Tax=Sporichthya polymorpha TaxID=35751 RepID=UPI0003675BCF|nr:hypothetical protein [Sporichthya polymorpha]
MKPRATFWVAAAAVLSLVSPGAWGAWHGTGNRNASLASAKLGYSLSGSNTSGGGYNWSVVLSLLGLATDQFSVTNTGTVPETIEAHVASTGLNLGSVKVYTCTVPFGSGINCSGTRLDLGNAPGTKTLAASLPAGATRYVAVQATGILGLALNVTMAANSFAITPIGGGANRTNG